MKVLSIGSDRSVFTVGSPARVRAQAYAQHFGELHVVAFSLKKHGLQTTRAGSLHLYPTNSLFKFLYVADAARLPRQLPGEAITVQDPFESGLAGVLSRRGRPLHVQLHTDPFAPAFKHSLLNGARRMLMHLVLARAARVRVVSRRLKEEVQKRYPHLPISVLPIFVDVEKFRSLTHTPHLRFSPALLWVGRFEKEKNPALALRALADISKEHPRAGLVMLGAGSLLASLRTLAQQLGVGERVEFPGWQDPTAYLTRANLLLATSHYEGYGQQVVEALAAGVPVLSRDVGIAKEAGASIASSEGFASALLECIKNGVKSGVLVDYPYKNFEEYVQAYCADITSTTL